jgi:cell division transport system permease protein
MKTQGATVAITGRLDRVKAWIVHHELVGRSTLTDLLKDPMASIMTWLVIGIALALPAILYVVLQNVSAVSGDWGGKPRLSLYFENGISVSVAKDLSRQIESMVEVEEVFFLSSDDALREFQHRSGFGEVLNTLERNPLPHVLEVMPAVSDPLVLGMLAEDLQGRQHIARVSVDLEWLERLFAILAFAERLITALALVLAMGVLLVMGNTIRLAIENRKQEIEVVKLVGGTDAFVRRPFLYLGLWYGTGGAMFAVVLVQISLFFLSSPVEHLAQSYRDDFALEGPGIIGYLALVLLGGALGILGSTLAVTRHLSEIEPA